MQSCKKYAYSPASLIFTDGQYGSNCVYLGDAQSAKDRNWLDKNKIVTVISIG